MDARPYFCPDCRSNRVKFSRLTTISESFIKDAATGAIMEQQDAMPVPEAEPTIRCNVCNFTGNEMRFIKQAERDPRAMTPTVTVYR
jgi:hypothetical protein